MCALVGNAQNLGFGIVHRTSSKCCPNQCWAGIEKKNTRGYGYLTNQPRPYGTGVGYDMSSSILARVELNTRPGLDEVDACSQGGPGI